VQKNPVALEVAPTSAGLMGRPARALARRKRPRSGRIDEAGAKRLAVDTPSFPVDCLENLEEIGMAGRVFSAHPLPK